MKDRWISGIGIAVLGLLMALVPAWIFPACTKLIETAEGGTVPMKCFWSGRAEIGLGLLILCGGILLIVFKSPLARIGVSCMIALTGVLGILVPSVLIGGCKMSSMACRATTFPALYVLSGLTVAACVANVLYLWRRNRINSV